MLRRIPLNQEIPPLHGVAWRDFRADVLVTAPVPFNWTIAAARAAWGFARFGTRAMVDAPRAAYAAGRRDGRQQLRADVGQVIAQLERDGDEHGAARLLRLAIGPAGTATDHRN